MASSHPVAPAPEIRPLAVADLPAARALWTAAEGVEMAEGDSPEELAAYLARNPGLSQAAWRGDRLVGAILAGHDGRRGLLYHLAVRPEERGRGTGRTLMARALAGLKQHGIRRVLLLVARDNPGGREFWLKRGWEPVDLADTFGFDL
jgi:ribosomal protein S18 acetylase RimI-like enzyme